MARSPSGQAEQGGTLVARFFGRARVLVLGHHQHLVKNSPYPLWGLFLSAAPSVLQLFPAKPDLPSPLPPNVSTGTYLPTTYLLLKTLCSQCLGWGLCP